MAHEDDAYQEWGARGTGGWPRAPMAGAGADAGPHLGAATSGVDGLWARQTTQGLAPQDNRSAQTGRLAADMGYGSLPRSGPAADALCRHGTGRGATRTYRWARDGPGARVQIQLEGTRQDAGGLQPVNQGLRLQVQWAFNRWAHGGADSPLPSRGAARVSNSRPRARAPDLGPLPVTNGAFEARDSDSIQGAFYGPDAQEVGGVFDGSHLLGAFGATR